jgi:phage-related minor tail protein
LADSLSIIFKAVDEMSGILDRMANSGAGMIEQWEQANATANTAFSAAEIGAGRLEKAISSASGATDNWTEALGNYDKSLMEAVYSTEELVDLGYKTEDALAAASAGADEMVKTIEDGTKVADEFQAAIAEQQAELERLQKAYIGVALTMGENSDEAKALKGEIGDLSKTLEENQSEWTRLGGSSEDAGSSGENAVQVIEQALAAAGLTKLVSEVTQAVIDMTNEFSEAQVTIVRATGATGGALSSLESSMMKLYAGDDDALGEVAGLVGELSTRLRLQGPELERVTSLFQDYNQATGEEGVGSVQSVTKVMKNWGVEIANTEGLLDSLILAGQMSGASVNTLSDMVVTNKATLQQLGYGLEESIALLAMFESEGLNASSIMMGFRSAVTNFAADGLDASAAMQEVISQIAGMASESEATALAIDTFGSRAGAELAYSIRSGKFEIEQWIQAVGSADGTLAKTANAATTLEEKWSKAGNSLQAAFSNVLTPAIDAGSSAFAGFVDGVGTFLQNNEWAAYVLIGLGAAIGVIAIALAGYTIATTIATVVTTAFGVASMTALWPLYLIAAAIGALIAIGVALFNWANSMDEEWAGLTSTSKQHYEAVQELNAEYERTVELEGENSEAAKELAAELETARAVYEANRMTMEELVAQNDALLESHQAIMDSYNESMSAINGEEKSTGALITKLEQLSKETNLSAVEQNQMSAIVQKLNEQMPDLALAYDAQTGALSGSVEAIKAYSQAQAEQQRQDAEYAAYTGALEERLALEEHLNKVREQGLAAQAEVESLDFWNGDFAIWNHAESTQKVNDLQALKDEYDRLSAALDEANGLISETEAGWEAESKAAAEALANQTAEQKAAAKLAEENLSRAVDAVESGYVTAGKAALLYGVNLDDLTAAVERNEAHAASLEEAAIAVENGMLNAAEAMSIYGVSANELADAVASRELETTVADTINSIGSLVEAYTAAYDEAYNSISGQIGLFDNMAVAVADYAKSSAAELDPANMIKALETQAQYLADYEANLNRAKELGLDANLAAQLSDGSVESAAKLDAIVNGGEEKIGELNAAFAKVEEGKTSFSNTVAEMKTNFSTEMDALAGDLEDALGDMDLYEESKNSAVSTIQGYIDGIDSMLPTVLQKLQLMVPSIGAEPSGAGSNIPGYATGTVSAESGWGIVGENGPELLNFSGGETIIPADETSRLLSSAQEAPFALEAPQGFGAAEGGAIEHRHVIEINGSGEFEVNGADETLIISVVMDNIRPIVTRMFQEEILTGGGNDDF